MERHRSWRGGSAPARASGVRAEVSERPAAAVQATACGIAAGRTFRVEVQPWSASVRRAAMTRRREGAAIVPEWLGWLAEDFPGGMEIGHDVLVARIGAALILGCFVAGIYALTQPRHQEKTLVTTLVMLSVLIAMVTLVIGSSVARAFSLVGALAIVRFRTLVEDTRDTAFVMFAVGVGMAAGAGSVVVALIAAPIVALVAL